MGIALVLGFTAGELAIEDYTTIDINRQADQTHINITNNSGDMGFNAIYDQILELMGDENSFTVKIRQEKGEATFTGMTADYYLNSMAEILHFGKLKEE